MADDDAKDLLAIVKEKVAEQAACGDDKDAKAAAKAALGEALNNLLMLVAKANKDQMDASVRSELDTALLADAEGLKWPLLKGLKWCILHRAYLGLPNTMEQTRRYFTNISANKCKEILEEGLSADLAKCEDSVELRWVEEVLVFMTGAGRFKKDLCGFELKGPGKNICKKMINQAKKRKQVLDGGIQCVRQGGKTSGKGSGEIVKDFRLDEVERSTARTTGIETIFDQALKLSDEEYAQKHVKHMDNLQQQKESRLKATKKEREKRGGN